MSKKKAPNYSRLPDFPKLPKSEHEAAKRVRAVYIACHGTITPCRNAHP